MIEFNLRGNTIIIDDQDRDLLKFKWYVSLGYAHRKTYAGKVATTISMHREIMGAKKGQQVDHINRNPLDNRRSNLRLCSGSQNRANSTGNKIKTTSKYRGVYPRHCRRHDYGKCGDQCGGKKWRARIVKDAKVYELGNFHAEEEAAIAYDKKAFEFFGEFAHQNVPWVIRSLK